MNFGKFALAKISGAVLLLASICSSVVANETVIQEKMSFKTCLNVINMSEIKLSIVPKITDEGEQKHVAVFKLTDGRPN